MKIPSSCCQLRYKEVFKPSPEAVTIVMEYADDGDLQGKLTQARNLRRPVPEEQVLSWLAQVVLALDHLHANGIIHRDIKTANMFLTKDGTLKLGDFGVSRQFDESADPEMIRCKTPVVSDGLCAYLHDEADVVFAGHADVHGARDMCGWPVRAEGRHLGAGLCRV